jgi:hypothetical protein
MTWEDVIQKIRSTLLGRNLASPNIRLNALTRIDGFITLYCPEVKADPTKLNRYSKDELISMLSRSKENGTLNSAEISIVNNLYQVINGEGMRSRARGRGSSHDLSSTGTANATTPLPGSMRNAARDKDEHYVIDLCDEVLGMAASRQHRFDFLRGDARLGSAGVTLPVDAFYPALKLVVEYRERQHTEAVDHFDKPDRVTVSGVHRGEQRKIYDQRRREVLPQHSIDLVELSYVDFAHDSRKRLRRSRDEDISVVRDKLAAWLSFR